MQFMNSQRGKLGGADRTGGAAAVVRDEFTAALVLAVVVTAACMFGVWTRMAGQLAVTWPANALLLGLLLRYPRLDNAGGWIGAAAGYLLAGHLSDDPLPISVLLTLCNFASVTTGYVLLARPGSQARALVGASGVLQLLGIIGLASAAGGLAGSIVSPMIIGGRSLTGGLSWFVSEAVNYIAILPATLTIPSLTQRPVPRQWRRQRRWQPRRIFPFLALVLSLACGLLVGGPGAVAFPVPALLWCGMRYGVFPTAVLTLLTTTWSLVVISKGYLDMGITMETPQLLMSLRLGVTLIAVSPVAVASAMAANRALLKRLRHMAEHDPLTGAMNRRAFAEHAGLAMQQAEHGVGLLILDIDRFKSVNDTYGHAAGDQVIVHVASTLRQHLPSGPPLLGRLGGEEFAVLLPDCDRQQALAMAERMRLAFSDTPVPVGGGRSLRVTVSIGLCMATDKGTSLDALLQRADRALYQAKHGGRNQVVLDTL